MPKPTDVTVTFSSEQTHELINLLQLMTVMGVTLYVDGPQPNIPLLKEAFRAMAIASMAKHMEPRAEAGT